MQTFLRIVCYAYVVPLSRERRAKYPRDLRLIIDNQNSSRHGVVLPSEDYIIGGKHVCERSAVSYQLSALSF